MTHKIEVVITSDDDRETRVSGEDIDAVIAAIIDFHTMGDFEKSHFEKKGKLKKELASGWYVKKNWEAKEI